MCFRESDLLAFWLSLDLVDHVKTSEREGKSAKSCFGPADPLASAKTAGVEKKMTSGLALWFRMRNVKTLVKEDSGGIGRAQRDVRDLLRLGSQKELREQECLMTEDDAGTTGYAMLHTALLNLVLTLPVRK